MVHYDEEFASVKKKAYRTVADLFLTLCGHADGEDRVTGLQKDMQHEFARQLETARELGNRQAEAEGRKDIHRLEAEASAALAAVAAAKRDWEANESSRAREIERMQADNQQKLEIARKELDKANAEFRMKLNDMLELRSKLERKLAEEKADKEHAENKVRWLESQLANSKSSAGGQADALEEHQRRISALESANGDLENQLKEREDREAALSKDLQVARDLCVREARRADEALANVDSLHKEVAKLRGELEGSAQMVAPIKSTLGFGAQAGAPVSSLVDQESATDGDFVVVEQCSNCEQMQEAMHELEGKVRALSLAKRMADKKAEDVAYHMAKQTKEFLLKAKAEQTKDSKRAVARVSNKLQFKDFSKQHASIIGNDDNSPFGAMPRPPTSGGLQQSQGIAREGGSFRGAVRPGTSGGKNGMSGSVAQQPQRSRQQRLPSRGRLL